MSSSIYSIAAMDEGRVIGKDNRLPWDIPEDVKRFSELTRGHTVLMGRKTYLSLPENVRPLPHRKNVVVTRSPEKLAGETQIEVCRAPIDFVKEFRASESGTLWIVGGEEIYRVTLPFVDQIYLTVVRGRHEGDTFFPEFESEFSLVEEEDHEGFSYLRFQNNTAL